jgi:hypothetical protein
VDLQETVQEIQDSNMVAVEVDQQVLVDLVVLVPQVFV